MVFGDRTKPAEPSNAGDWIVPACNESWGTVAGLVPDQYPLVLRVDAPESDIDDWWLAYRELFELVASVGAQHTSNPEHAHFGVWEGHGYNTTSDELGQIPRLELPHRSYYLLSGHVSAAAHIEHPGSVDWRNPDLFWPYDQRWFVATDVDFWCLYVAGDQSFVAEVADCVPMDRAYIDFEHELEAEC